jgi:DNA-directed RNA polymerase subunit D
MKVKVVKQKDNRIEFNVSGIKENQANALRRIIISEVPVMAIEKVIFYDNSSAMDDEVLAHRLGLIPLKTDPAGPESIELSLKAEGPKTVYSRELKPAEMKVKGKAIPSEGISAHEKIPIMKLTEEQSIDLKAIAQLGTGKEHIKWQGGLASYDIKDDGSFEFFVESYGQMPVNDFIGEAFEVFNKKIKELKSSMK